MLTLFHAPHSRSSRILWLMEELGVPYDLRHVGIRYADGSGPGPDQANIHPDKKVPALLHDGVLVTESTAIAIYLCEIVPEAGLAPAPGAPDRGAFLAAMCWADNEFGMNVYLRRAGMKDARSQANYEAAMRRAMDALSRGPYLMGEQFTALDIMAGLVIVFAREHLPASDLIDAYVARVTHRPAFARAMAKDALPAQAT